MHRKVVMIHNLIYMSSKVGAIPSNTSLTGNVMKLLGKEMEIKDIYYYYKILVVHSYCFATMYNIFLLGWMESLLVYIYMYIYMQ